MNRKSTIRKTAIPSPLVKTGINRKLHSICKKNNIVFMGLFGSYSRGEQKKRSDIDIAIEFDGKRNHTLLTLVRIENELTNIFGRKVDLGTLNSINPHVKKSIIKDLKVLYERR